MTYRYRLGNKCTNNYCNQPSAFKLYCRKRSDMFLKQCSGSVAHAAACDVSWLQKIITPAASHDGG